ncbi:MAG: hypothetical protein I8H75_05140 [Myxococcaceae bacterium]|nr:hypothetical protein [Myxococcaceae bacterium]MBH2006708.1 hypothetical protein [Myxococcaceae bacterium]
MKFSFFCLSIAFYEGTVLASGFGVFELPKMKMESRRALGVLEALAQDSLKILSHQQPFSGIYQFGSQDRSAHKPSQKRSREEGESSAEGSSSFPVANSDQNRFSGAGGHGGDGQDPSKPRKTNGARVDEESPALVLETLRVLVRTMTRAGLTAQQAEVELAAIRIVYARYIELLQRSFLHRWAPSFLQRGVHEADRLLGMAQGIHDQLVRASTLSPLESTPHSRGTHSLSQFSAPTPGALQADRLIRALESRPGAIRAVLRTELGPELAEINDSLRGIRDTSEFAGLNHRIDTVGDRIDSFESTHGEHYTNLVIMIQELRSELKSVRNARADDFVCAQPLAHPNDGRLLDLGSVSEPHANDGRLLDLDSDSEPEEKSLKQAASSGKTNSKMRSKRASKR